MALNKDQVTPAAVCFMSLKDAKGVKRDREVLEAKRRMRIKLLARGLLSNPLVGPASPTPEPLSEGVEDPGDDREEGTSSSEKSHSSSEEEEEEDEEDREKLATEILQEQMQQLSVLVSCTPQWPSPVSCGPSTVLEDCAGQFGSETDIALWVAVGALSDGLV